MTYEQFWQPLTAFYPQGEAKAIARMVMELRFNLSLTDVLVGKVETLDADELRSLQIRLLTGEPVQYVLGVAEFGGRTFQVEPGVLIPRPETYELCQWCLPPDPTTWKGRILDIGTGSGCIACTLAAELPQAEVTAWDISDEALRIAAANAKRINVHVSFEQVDILHLPPPPSARPAGTLRLRRTLNSQLSARPEGTLRLRRTLNYIDLIVSNPPYICQKERTAMERNVLEHEPELALFVPDDDPLLFYRSIARFAAKALNPGGALFFEINPLYVNELQQMLGNEGFSQTEVRTDQFGKQRFTKSWL